MPFFQTSRLISYNFVSLQNSEFSAKNKMQNASEGCDSDNVKKITKGKPLHCRAGLVDFLSGQFDLL